MERAEGVALWAMMSLSLAFLAHSYTTTQLINYTLLFLFVIGVIVLKTAWGILAWRSPLMIDVEKAERIAFWTMSLISLGLLTLEYVTTGFFDYYIFYVFIAGLLAFVVSYLLPRIRSKSSERGVV